jgi:hypothetical protein
MSAQEDFEQIKRQVVDPIQHDYEAIRPVVLFSETAAARSLETGIERTVLGDKARRFITEGMLGLADQRPGSAGRKGHVYPDAIAAHILYLKQVYPPIHWREIVHPQALCRSSCLAGSTGVGPAGVCRFCRCLPGALDGGAHGL